MSNLTLFQRGYGRRKPGPWARVDWSSASLSSLVDCLIFNEGGGATYRNSASPANDASASGSPVFQPAGGLLGLYCTGGNAATIPDHVNYSAADYTVRVLHQPKTWPGGFTCLFDKIATVNRQLSYFFDTSGNLSFTGVGGTNSSQSVTLGMTTGSLWDFAAVRSGTGSNNVTLYVNGISKGTISDGGTSSVGTGQALSFGGNPTGGGSTYDGTYVLCQIWTRALAIAEIWQLYQQPFGFLQQSSLSQYSSQSPPAGYTTAMFPYTETFDVTPARRGVVSY